MLDYIAQGGVVLNTTQCAIGMVEQGKYETSSFFEKHGVISGKDLTTEAAVTKMMYVLGKAKGDMNQIKQLLTSCCIVSNTRFNTQRLKKRFCFDYCFTSNRGIISS